MVEDEDRPRQPPRFTPAVLDRWDVAELRAYIDSLRAEIARAEAAIAARQSQRSAAEALFRRPSEG